ncbi:hypothetical protein D3C78_1747830 [compost metagenome]
MRAGTAALCHVVQQHIRLAAQIGILIELQGTNLHGSHADESDGEDQQGDQGFDQGDAMLATVGGGGDHQLHVFLTFSGTFPRWGVNTRFIPERLR